jgi:hypothetical protein
VGGEIAYTKFPLGGGHGVGLAVLGAADLNYSFASFTFVNYWVEEAATVLSKGFFGNIGLFGGRSSHF